MTETPRQEPAARASLAVHVSAGAWVTCHRYRYRAPILAVHGPEVSLTVSPPVTDGPTSAADVRFARRLAEAAAQYLAECERLCPVKENATPAAAVAYEL